MEEQEKVIHINNLVLFNKCVQNSGGILTVECSYTDEDGDMYIKVNWKCSLTNKCLNEYESNRYKS
jgi:hypothetical protein